MPDAVVILQTGFSANSMFLSGVFKDFPQEKAGTSLSENTNAFDRIAGHIVSSRIALFNFLGLECAAPDWGAFGEFSTDFSQRFLAAVETPRDLMKLYLHP